MKIVFNFIFLVSLLASVPARAEGVYFSTRDLLADFFRSSESVTYKKIELNAGDKTRLERRLGYSLARPSYTFFVAQSAGKVDGYALIDEELGEHLPITFAVKLTPAGVVERQEIVIYREDEVRDARFRKQFVGKCARDPIAVDRDIDSISGATISSRAMAAGVKRAVVLFEELVKPATAATASAATARHPGTY
jgi:hypothetical protein